MDQHSGARFVLLVAAALCALQGMAQTRPPTVRIPRASRPPRLEDFLNGAPREAGAQITDFRQRNPKDGAPVSQPTSAYLSYDDKNLYVIFVCKDEPGQVRARLTKREDIFPDDLVGILLDTFHDRQRAYMFFTNAYGVQLDGIVTEGQNDDYSFDTLWRSEGRMTGDGYLALIAIPFRSLRFANSPSQTWGIALYRSILRNNENTFWPHITNRVAGFTQQMATLEGLDQVSPGRNLQFIPYGAFGHSRFLDTKAPAFRSQKDGRAGLDGKVVLRDALTLDLALNPDFSQVESDEPQVTVNQRFEVFFPEKRPFFIENSGFFQTPENLFFSRRIADPQFGARLTGKLGGWAIGALAADDRAPGQRIPQADPLHGGRAGIGVVRVRREFSRQSSIGLLATSRDFGAGSNRVFSLDTRLKLNSNWVLSGQMMRSYTRELDRTRRSGPAYFAELSRSGLRFNYNGRYSDRSPDFDARKLGFIPRVDIRQTEHFANFRWRPEGRRLISYGPFAWGLVNWDRQNRLQDWLTGAGFGMEFSRLNFFDVNRIESFELFQGHGFRKSSTGVFFFSQWLKWLNVNGSYRQGDGVNYFPASGLAPFLANSRDAQFQLTLRPKPNVRFDQTYIHSRLMTRRGLAAALGIPAVASIFNNHILRSKLNYQFTRALSLRTILDYNAVLSNPLLVSQERAKRFTADVLATYLISPGTALYVGYTDRYENLALDSTVEPRLRRTVSPTTLTGRQFFVKLSYLFRF